MIKVCYVLSYKSPNYVRTTTLVESLKLISDIRLFQVRNSNQGFLRYFQTLLKFLYVRTIKNPDVYIIGFRGHEIYWLLRIFALKKIFIFDEMMSPYDSYINERKICSKDSSLAKIFYIVEKSILKNTNYILTDTNLHADYFVSLFKIDKVKIKVIPVGTDERLFNLKSTKAENFGKQFTVFFYATFLPLHGVDVILDSAKILEEYPIRFIIVGGKGKKVEGLDLKNITHFEWLKYEDLPKYIKGADICLGGPFGGTNQARRVVTGKTYQFLAMGKPTIIGKIDEDFGFKEKRNCLLVRQRNVNDLTDAILWCFKNKKLLRAIGRNGSILFSNSFDYKSLSCKLSDLLNV